MLKDQFIGMNYKTKSDIKHTANRYKYFLESSFVGVNRLFVSIYANQGNNAKRFNVPKCYLPKCIISGHQWKKLL